MLFRQNYNGIPAVRFLDPANLRGSGRPQKITLLVKAGLIEKMQKVPEMRFGGTKAAKKKSRTTGLAVAVPRFIQNC
ncbi:hypothetical protein QTP88_015845 [Uroleucon formosanum]